MLSLSAALLTTAVMALVTFFTRVVPFLFFRGKKPPSLILFAGRYIPPMVMTLLVVYALKDVPFTNPPYGLPELIAAVLTGTLHLWKRNALLSIVGGTAAYMVFVQTGVFLKLFGM